MQKIVTIAVVLGTAFGQAECCKSFDKDITQPPDAKRVALADANQLPVDAVDDQDDKMLVEPAPLRPGFASFDTLNQSLCSFIDREVLRQACLENNYDAQLQIGIDLCSLHYFKNAKQFLYMAVAHKGGEAYFYLGKLYYLKGKSNLAWQYFKLAADHGYSLAYTLYS